VANEAIPYKRPGEDVTGYATAAITGKRCVQISGAKTNEKGEGLATVTTGGGAYRIALPSGAGANGGAGKWIFGVAKYDIAANKWGGVIREGIVPITTSGALTAGQGVQVAADGTVVVLSTGVLIGYACDDCASGADAEIALAIS
jgi:predicted RecA/RadA family phage recombinase